MTKEPAQKSPVLNAVADHYQLASAKCGDCGYSLAGLELPVRCPECGAHNDPRRAKPGFDLLVPHPHRLRRSLLGLAGTQGIASLAIGVIVVDLSLRDSPNLSGLQVAVGVLGCLVTGLEKVFLADVMLGTTRHYRSVARDVGPFVAILQLLFFLGVAIFFATGPTSFESHLALQSIALLSAIYFPTKILAMFCVLRHVAEVFGSMPEHASRKAATLIVISEVLSVLAWSGFCIMCWGLFFTIPLLPVALMLAAVGNALYARQLRFLTGVGAAVP